MSKQFLYTCPNCAEINKVRDSRWSRCHACGTRCDLANRIVLKPEDKVLCPFCHSEDLEDTQPHADGEERTWCNNCEVFFDSFFEVIYKEGEEFFEKKICYADGSSNLGDDDIPF